MKFLNPTCIKECVFGDYLWEFVFMYAVPILVLIFVIAIIYGSWRSIRE